MGYRRQVHRCIEGQMFPYNGVRCNDGNRLGKLPPRDQPKPSFDIRGDGDQVSAVDEYVKSTVLTGAYHILLSDDPEAYKNTFFDPIGHRLNLNMIDVLSQSYLAACPDRLNFKIFNSWFTPFLHGFSKRNYTKAPPLLAEFIQARQREAQRRARYRKRGCRQPAAIIPRNARDVESEWNSFKQRKQLQEWFDNSKGKWGSRQLLRQYIYFQDFVLES